MNSVRRRSCIFGVCISERRGKTSNRNKDKGLENYKVVEYKKVKIFLEIFKKALDFRKGLM
jgi:hypothetical protein